MMKPQRLGNVTIPDEELRTDKKTCRKIGPCGIGKKAVYLNSFYIERRYYIPVSSIKRIFKRIAMSKGGFTGKGTFGTLPYLVVIYENGKEKQCNFKHEEDVDRFLAYIEETFPQIPVHSAEAERKLIEKQLTESIRNMEEYIKDYPDFPVPAYYAHPVVLERMQEILRNGRARTIPEALQILKKDLKALNSSVVVEQEEYEEVVAIKPMFLVMDYK